MDDQLNDGLWWAVAIIDSAVGSGILLYGIRQKAGMPLVFGLALSIFPMFAPTGMMELAVTVLMGVAYYFLKQLA